MNTIKKGNRRILNGRIVTAAAAAVAMGTALIPQNAEAVFNYEAGYVYQQNFDGLGTGNTTTTGLNQAPYSTGRNDWFAGAYNINAMASTGASDPGGPLNLGAANNVDRAYGFRGPSASNAIGVEFRNAQVNELSRFTIGVDLEVWRRPVDGTVKTFELQYFVSPTPIVSLTDPSVGWVTINTWSAPPSPIANDPNQPLYSNRFDGTVTPTDNGFQWTGGSYLYFRLKTNSSNSAIALDNMVFSAIPEPSTWVAGGLLLGFAAFTQFRRRKIAVEVAA